MNTFRKIAKKRGFIETMSILLGSKNYRMTLREFRIEIEYRYNSYYNSFHRVKEEMIEINLIEFRKSRNMQKTLCLTEKGITIARKLKEIEKMMEE